MDLVLLHLLDDARRVRRAIGTGKLDRVAYAQPGALVARDRALDEKKTADRVRADDLEVLLRAIAGAHVAGHLLVLEDATRILPVAGRTVRAVRNRNAVGRAETAEAPALHRTGKALALRHAGDVHHLARNEVVRADVRANVEQSIFIDAEFDHSGLGLDLGLAEGDALRLGDILGLGLAGAKLDGGIAVLVHFATADDLHVVQLQNGNRHMPTVRLEQAGHSDLLCDHAGAHDQTPPQRHTRTIPGCVTGPIEVLLRQEPCPSKCLRAPPGLVLPQGSGGDAARS